MKKFEELKNQVSAAEKDATAFYKNGNAAAGTRLRKALQEIKVAATAIRAEVMQLKNKV
jgi:hypothetical protein